MSLNSLNTGPPPAHPHRVLTIGNRIIISHPLLVVGVGWGGDIKPTKQLNYTRKRSGALAYKIKCSFCLKKKKLFSIEVPSELRG